MCSPARSGPGVSAAIQSSCEPDTRASASVARRSAITTGGDHPAKPQAQLLDRDVGQDALQLREAPRAARQVADDQQRPLVADEIERTGVRRPLVVQAVSALMVLSLATWAIAVRQRLNGVPFVPLASRR